jgi:hypothetical protein
MKNMGRLNPNLNPIKAGGLSSHEVAYLKQQGWIEGVTEKDVDEAPIGFVAPELPGGYTMHNYSVPKGTEYLYNPEDERAILRECGNPTCWRYLLK